MRTYIITVTITPMAKCKTCENGYKAIDKSIMFRITATPLTVSFDKLVAALSCPRFPLKALQEDVAHTVLAVAVGTNPKEICSVDKNPFEGSNGYTWAVAPNQTALTYVAKRDGTPTDNNYDFKIIFPVDNDGKSEPRVWVKDVPKDNACDEVKSALQDASRYQNYDLKIYIGSTANVCVGDYGSAKSGELLRATQSKWPYAMYGTGCIAGTLACTAVMLMATGGLSIGAVASNAAMGIAGCATAAAVGWALTPFTLGAKLMEDTSTKTQYGILTLIGGATTWETYKLTQKATYYAFVRSKTGTEIIEGLTRAMGYSSFEVGQESAKIEFFKAITGLDDIGQDTVKTAKNLRSTIIRANDKKDMINRLRNLARAVRGVDDELANSLDDLAKAVENGNDKLAEEATNKLLKIATNSKRLETVITKLKEIQNAKKLTQKQQFICGVAGQALGATFASLTAMAQMARTDILAVQITPKDIVNIGFTYDPDLHRMIFAG